MKSEIVHVPRHPLRVSTVAAQEISVVAPVRKAKILDGNLGCAREELMKAYEAKAGLFCARMAAHASLFRTESRFGFYHQRTDFPEKDDKTWKARVIISRGPDGPILEKEKP